MVARDVVGESARRGGVLAGLGPEARFRPQPPASAATG
jgi:hypothetical protein